MSRLLVIEITDGQVSAVSTDTGKELDLSVAVIEHNEKYIYRIGEAEQGAEEIVSLCKTDNYNDEDDGGKL